MLRPSHGGSIFWHHSAIHGLCCETWMQRSGVRPLHGAWSVEFGIVLVVWLGWFGTQILRMFLGCEKHSTLKHLLDTAQQVTLKRKVSPPRKVNSEGSVAVPSFFFSCFCDTPSSAVDASVLDDDTSSAVLRRPPSSIYLPRRPVWSHLPLKSTLPTRAKMGLPWLMYPLLAYNYREPAACELTPEQCAFQSSLFRNW